MHANVIQGQAGERFDPGLEHIGQAGPVALPEIDRKISISLFQREWVGPAAGRPGVQLPDNLLDIMVAAPALQVQHCPGGWAAAFQLGLCLPLQLAGWNGLQVLFLRVLPSVHRISPLTGFLNYSWGMGRLHRLTHPKEIFNFRIDTNEISRLNW
ncbi:MAG TPA: hypothetical protein VF498_19485 [Anaerolineales bacterium]